MSRFTERSLLDLTSFIVDNRGRTCPTAEDGLPLIATNCLKAGSREVVFENVRYVDRETYSTWFRSHPEPGDVLFVCKGSPGRVAIVPSPVSFCIAQDMVALRAANDVWPGYLYYRIAAPDVQFGIQNMHVGTMIPHFKKGDFGNLSIRVHRDIGEQRAIAEVLGALDDKIAANSQLVVVADQLASALLETEMDGTVEALADCATVTMGSSPPGTSYNEDGDGMPFFQGVRDFGVRFPTRRVWTTSPVRTAEPGDVLLSVRAPVGKTNIAREQLCIGRGLASIRSTAGTPFTMFHQIRAAGAEWAPYESEGTIFGSINKVALGTIRIPSIRAQSRLQLESRLEALEGRIAAALTESDLLAKTRDDVLPLLMSGKLRVKDAEKKVEAIA